MTTKSSILIVDDDPYLLKTLSDILTVKGYTPIGAAMGKEALDRVEKEKPVVALIDLKLEDISGLEVLREIKKRSPDTECIVVTGHASQSSAIEAINLGAYSYIQKPYNMEQLLVTIRRAIEKREAAKALQESEEKYRNLVERANDGICIIQDTIVKYANPRLAEMWGGTVEEVIGTPFTDYVYPDELPEVVGRYKRRMAGEGVTSTYETVLRRKDGGKVYAELNAGTITYQGKPADLIIVRDITERKQAEERLQLLSSATEQSSEGIAMSNLEGNLLFVNNAFAAMHGYTSEELIGKHLSIFHTPEQMPAVDAATRQIQETGEFSGEIWHVRRDGTVFPALMHNSLLRDEAGTAIGMIGTLRDITEYKRAEEQILVANARLQYLLSSTSAVIYTAKTSGDYGTTFISENVIQMVGYEPRDFLEESSFWIDHVHPEDMQRILPELSRIFERDHYVYEYRFLHKDGTYICVRDEMKLVRDEEGKPLEIVGYWMDITERKRAEKALRESEEKFRNLAEQSPNMIFINQKGRVVYANKRCEEIMGYKREEFYSPDFDFLTLIAPEYTDLVRANYSRHVEGEDIPPYEYALITKTGERVEAIIAPKVIRYEGELAILGIMTDITELRRAEDALKRAELEKAIILDSMSELVAYQDTEMRILWANKAAFESSGVAPEQFVGRLCYEIWRQSSEPCAGCPVVKVCETGQPQEAEITSPDDGRVWFIRGYPVKDANGDIEGIVEVSQEITERKWTEGALRQRAVQLALLNEIGGEITAVLKLDSVLDRATRLVQESFGYHHVALFTVDREQSELVMKARAGEFADLFPPDHRLELDQGVVGWVGLHDETLLVNDVDVEPRYVNLYPGVIPTRSELSVPIRVGGEIVGVLDVQSPQRDAFDENDVMVMETLAGQIAVAIENARLFQESQRRVEEMAALREVNLAILSALERDQVFEVMLDQLSRVIDYDTAAMQVITPDERQKMIVGRGPIVYDQAMWDGFDARDNKLIQEMRETRQPVVVHDSHTDERYEGVGDWETFHSWVGAPLFVRDDLIGFLAIEKTSPGFYDERAMRLLADFAGAAAMALENARLYEDIRRERDYSQTLIATANALIVGLDLEGRITLFNDFCAEITGYTQEEVQGRDWFTTLLPERERLPTGQFFRELLEQDLSSQRENSILTKDGRERVIAWSNTVIRDAEGRPVSVLAIGQDVTERKRAEEALTTERERLAVTLRSIGDGVVTTDAEGRIVLANPRAQEYLALLTDTGVGDVLSHLGGQPLERLLHPPPEGRTFHEVILEGPPRRVFEVMTQPMEAGSQTGGWVLVLRDVTEEREVQQRIQQQERLAAVGQLAAGIAHDFNNLLTSIIGFAELLHMRADMPGPAREDLAHIVGQGQRAAHLIRQILDFSRRSVIQQRPLDLMPFLKEAARFLERTIPESVHIVLETTPGEYLVNADPTQMQQVLTNLAVNAQYAMPEGGELRLRLSRFPMKAGERALLPDMKPGEWITLSVSDTGVGIPPEVLPHIFEPFFTTKEVGEGTGLGLAQVYGIVKQHDGYIDVESQVGKGTTFAIYLPPLAVGEEVPVEKAPQEIPFGQGQTVLLVEDESQVLETGKAMLEHLGYRVLTATNGQQALEVHAEHKDEIALVLSDMVMPKMGGLELYRILHRRDPAIKMVVVTGYPLGEETKDPLPQGILGWIEKPFLVEKLAQVLHQVLKT